MQNRLQNKPARWSKARLCGLLVLAILASGSFCEDTPQAGEGNVDRPGGVIAFTANGKTYGLLPLPQIQHMRVFSLTSNVFVAAPNVYFPLSIPLGPFTHRVVVDPNHNMAFALDSVDGAVRAIRLGTAQDTKALKVLGDAIPAGIGPSGLAVHPTAEKPRLYVASSLSGEVIEIETEADVSDHQLLRVIPAGVQPSDIAFVENPTGQNTLVVTDADSSMVSLINVDTGVRTALDIGGPSSRVVASQIDLSATETQVPIALVFRLDSSEIFMLRFDTAQPLHASITAPDLPLDAVVLSSQKQNKSVCTGVGLEDGCAYAAVITIKGALFYLNLAPSDDQPPHFLDNNSELPGPKVEDLNTDTAYYDPNSDAENAYLTRPTVEIEAITSWGDPPALIQNGDVTYLYTYQGIIPQLRARLGQYDLSNDVFSDSTAGTDLAALGAQVGDILSLPVQAGCPSTMTRQFPIVAVSANSLQISGAQSATGCIDQAGGVRYDVRAGEQFTVAYLREDEATAILDRVSFGQPFDAKIATVVINEATDSTGNLLGAPATGAVLGVPIEDNFDARVLDFGRPGTLLSGVAVGQANDGGDKVWRMLVSAAGASFLFVIEPGTQGYGSSDLMPLGVSVYQ